MPGGARKPQEAPGDAWTRQEALEIARKRQEAPGGARKHQKAPGGARRYARQYFSNQGGLLYSATSAHAVCRRSPCRILRGEGRLTAIIGLAPGSVRKRQEAQKAPGPGGAWRRQEAPGGAGRRQGTPGGARRRQEAPGEAVSNSCDVQSPWWL